jgi:hypothetical protein
MMAPMSTRSRWLWLAVLTACGRSGFDPLGDAPGANASGDVRSSARLWLQMEESDPQSRMIGDTGVGDHTVLCATQQCPTSALGKHGKGFRFTGQQLQVVWQPDLDASRGYTIAMWAVLDQAPATGDFACGFTEPVAQVLDGNSYSLCATSSRTPYAFTTDATGGSQDELTLGVMAPATWVHLAASWEPVGIMGMGNKTFYVNGVATSSVVHIDFDQSPPVVGADMSTTPVYFWNGVLDDVVFFDRVLTQSEIVELAAP